MFTQLNFDNDRAINDGGQRGAVLSENEAIVILCLIRL